MTRRIASIAGGCAACFILSLMFSDRVEAGFGAGRENAVTFSRDVAPIFFRRCAECHRPGEAAPMSLLTYKEARPWARAIKEKVVRREMPPWHADPEYGEFANDPRLTQTEIDTIAAWTDTGAVEGDPRQLPTAPRFADGWRIGTPDLVLTMPEAFALDPAGPDEYRYFEIPGRFTEDVYVQMAEARPGNRKIVHHIIAYFVSPQDGSPDPQRRRGVDDDNSIFYRDGFVVRTKADAPIHDDGCELPSGGFGTRRDGTGEPPRRSSFAGYAPGSSPTVYEPGTARKIPAGSKVIFEVHYSKRTETAETDRSSVGLVFAKAKPAKEAMLGGAVNTYFNIPPGAERHKVSACWTTRDDIVVHSLQPHMHYRGAAMEFKVFYPNGRSEVLLWVPNYNFGWQTTYYLKKHLAIPRGSRFLVTGYFDNSANNKYNPDATRAVRWGEPTYDEMMVGFVGYTVDRSGSHGIASVNGSNRR